MIHPSTIGAICVVLGLGTILSQDIIIKNLSNSYSIAELLFIRSVFALVILALLLPFISPGNVLRSNRLGLQVLRGSLQFLSFGCYYIALKNMPILDLITLFFTAPLIALALSVAILKEKVSIHHWGAVVVGFIGSLIMIQPGGDGFNGPITVFALGAACLYAISIVVTRLLGQSDQSVTTTLYTCVMYASLGGMCVMLLEVIAPQLPADVIIENNLLWITPTIEHLLFLALAGLAVCIAFLLLAFAYRRAHVSVLVPWEYSALIWGGVFGYVFLNEIPSLSTLLGGALIVISGIYISRQDNSTT